MASQINISGITINEEEARDGSEAVFTKAFMKPELESVHNVMTGIQMKTQIPIYGRFGIAGKKSLGSCNVNAETLTSVATEKFWDPELINFRQSHCQEDIDQLFKMWIRNPDALKTWDTPDPEQDQFLADLTIDATMESILRITSLADESALNVSGGGNITNGVSVLFFTMIEGLWKQIFTAVAAGTTQRYQITENGAATEAAQFNLATDRALKVFRNLYEIIDTRAFRDGNLVFEVTNSIMLNWQAYLEDKSLAYSLDRTEEGATKYQYRGIPIIVRYDWTNNLKSYFDTGTKLYLPNRAILGPISNIPVGTSNESNLSDFNMFYDPVTKKLLTDVAYYIDCKLIENFMTAVAY